MTANQLNKNKEMLLIGLFSLMVLYLFIINLLSPIMGEDVALTAIRPHDDIVSLHEFFSKMFAQVKIQATNWNARIGELTSIVFSCFPKFVFDVFNTFATLGIIHIMYRYAYKNGGGQRTNYVHLLSFYILTLVLIILFLPKLGEILFWRTGSTNYWWSAGLLLLAGLPLRYYIGSERLDNIENNRWKIILFSALSFAAGFTNENNVCVFLFLYLCTITYDFIKYKREKAWVIMNFIYMSLGYFILLTCQSTKNRIAYYNSTLNIHGTFLENAIERIPNAIGTYFSTNYVILIIELAVIVLFITTSAYKFKNEFTQKFIKYLYKNFDVFGVYIVSLIAAAALIGSPYIEPRAYLLCNIFSMICICYYLGLSLENIQENSNPFRKRITKITVTTLSIIVSAAQNESCCRRCNS